MLSCSIWFSAPSCRLDGAVRRTAPSAPYTRPRQRLSGPPSIYKLGAQNQMLHARTHTHTKCTRGSGRLLCFDGQRTSASGGYHSCLVLCDNGDRAGLKPVVQKLEWQPEWRKECWANITGTKATSLVREIKVPASLIPKQSTSLNSLRKCFPNIYQYQALFAWWANCPYI